MIRDRLSRLPVIVAGIERLAHADTLQRVEDSLGLARCFLLLPVTSLLISESPFVYLFERRGVCKSNMRVILLQYDSYKRSDDSDVVG